MTKADLITGLATRTELTKRQVTAVLDGLAETASMVLRTPGEDFIVPGICKVKSVNRKARTGRNPSTGAAIQVPAKTVVKFTALKEMRDAANQKGEAAVAS